MRLHKKNNFIFLSSLPKIRRLQFPLFLSSDIFLFAFYILFDLNLGLYGRKQSVDLNQNQSLNLKNLRKIHLYLLLFLFHIQPFDKNFLNFDQNQNHSLLNHFHLLQLYHAWVIAKT